MGRTKNEWMSEERKEIKKLKKEGQKIGRKERNVIRKVECLKDRQTGRERVREREEREEREGLILYMFHATR